MVKSVPGELNQGPDGWSEATPSNGEGPWFAHPETGAVTRPLFPMTTGFQHHDTPADATLILLAPADLIRRALAVLISGMSGVRVVGESASASVGVTLVNSYSPDIVVIDADFPGVTRTIALLKRTNPGVHVLMLADAPGTAEVSFAITAGADAFAFKTDTPEDLEAAVRRLLRRAGPQT